MTITEFLTQRLDEDERDARNATGQYDFERDIQSGLTVFSLLHLMRHDPARVLAEVEAKRRIVAEAWGDLVEEEQYWAHEQGRPERTRADLESRGEAPRILRLLALPYADHPDYDEAWRP